MKKVLLSFAAVALVVASVPLFAAFEAHVINVTAHIENALNTHGGPIDFGTVFPQEYLERNFTVFLSDSFMSQERVHDVSYVIKQKPKCLCDRWIDLKIDGPTPPPICPEGQYAPVHYATHECPEGYTEMLSLCPYLSKLPVNDEPGDVGIPSYFVPDPSGGSCQEVTDPEHAMGLLSLFNDNIDEWTVDLKVPPVDGYVGQDWPLGCPTLSADSLDYGCDLWIEVTDIGNRVI